MNLLAPRPETVDRMPMRVAYTAGDGPLQGWAYGVEGRLPLDEEIQLEVKDGYAAVYRVGQGCKLWFVRLLPPLGQR